MGYHPVKKLSPCYLYGQFEIEMEYVANGRFADEIKYNRIIVVKPSQEDTLQAFRIYKIEKSILSGLIVVNAQHISYQLSIYHD